METGSPPIRAPISVAHVSAPVAGERSGGANGEHDSTARSCGALHAVNQRDKQQGSKHSAVRDHLPRVAGPALLDNACHTFGFAALSNPGPGTGESEPEEQVQSGAHAGGKCHAADKRRNGCTACGQSSRGRPATSRCCAHAKVVSGFAGRGASAQSPRRNSDHQARNNGDGKRRGFSEHQHNIAIG